MAQSSEAEKLLLEAEAMALIATSKDITTLIETVSVKNIARLIITLPFLLLKLLKTK
jgi:hypothetical protein